MAYLDGPGGTQVPAGVIEAMAGRLRVGTSNIGGAFGASREADAVVAAAREAMADFLGGRPDEVAFGQNMTSLTFAVSRALARSWGPGDEVVVTRLDHDANVTPWRLAAADRGAAVRLVDFDPADGTLDLAHLERVLGPRTRLLAVTAASNALGTVPPVRQAADLAHAAGALVYVDAVHYAPHRLVDVAALGADFLACSAYKFFGPHTGVLWGREALLEDPWRPTRWSPPRTRARASGRPAPSRSSRWPGWPPPWTTWRASGRAAPAGSAWPPPTPPSGSTRRPWPPASWPGWPDLSQVRLYGLADPCSPRRADPDLRPGGGRPDRPTKRRAASASRASTPGAATTTPWGSWSIWGSPPGAACCASASSTTTRSKKWTGCWRRWPNLRG